MNTRTAFWLGAFGLASFVACSNASTDCDKLGTCNEPPTTVGPGGSGPTTSGMGGTSATGTGGAGGTSTTGMGGAGGTSTTGMGGGGAPPTTCTDGVQSGDETDVDCGGSCPPCSLGDSCTEGTDCQSSHCVDDFCCDEACEGECRYCAILLMEGTCGVPVGSDPDNNCMGNKVCLPNGMCG